MNRLLLSLAYSFLIFSCASFREPASTDVPESQSYFLASPDHRVNLHFWINQMGQPRYALNFKDQPVLEESALGLQLGEASGFGAVEITRIERKAHDVKYFLPTGKSRWLHDQSLETAFEMRERSGLRRSFNIVFRISNDGAAFRYLIPAAFGKFVIQKELTTFRPHGNPLMYGMALPFNSTFEGYYQKSAFQEFKTTDVLNLPLLLGCDSPTSICLSLTEAGLSDSAGLYLARAGNAFEVQLDPERDTNLESPRISARAPFATAWRVALLGDSAGALLESNFITHLNEPSKIEDTSWIHPGKIFFPWWNDYVLKKDSWDQNPTHKPGLTTWAMKKYIDFCAQNKIEYLSLDGFDQAWYGGEIGFPPPEADVTKPIASLNLPEILRYGKVHGVRLRLWLHKNALLHSADMDQVFALYESWGIEGIMIDFLNADDQKTVQLYTRMIELSARHHLTINFHGSWKPTGFNRTYPNLLSHEAVMSSEYNRFVNRDGVAGGIVNGELISVGSPPEHEAIYTWVRQIAGSTDIHPGSFNPVLPENFDPDRDRLRAMGTLARQLALYVVVESGLPMVSDAPNEYLKRPEAFEFVKQVPAAWDEIKVLGGNIGESIVIARRINATWFLGAITDRKARTVKIPLTFLGRGTFAAEIYSDGPDTPTQPDQVTVRKISVSNQDTVTLHLAPSGGTAIRFIPK